MAFLKRKRIGGRTYLYVVHSYKEGRVVREDILQYLGSEEDIPARKAAEAVRHWQWWAEHGPIRRRPSMRTFGTLIVGNNEITDCEQALVVEGVEVFRLRERQHDGQLIVDFDLRDEKDQRLAKIAKNHVVHCAEDLEPRSAPGRYEVVRKSDGAPLAVVQEQGPTTIKLTGTFWVKGYKFVATDDGLFLPRGSVISRCGVSGFKTALVLDHNTMILGAGGGRG